MKAPHALTISEHRLSEVPFMESPNQDARPDPKDISLIVIHAISLPPGEFGGPGVGQLFTNTLPSGEHPFYETILSLKVSAHLFVRRDGSIVQFVDFNRRAWHAGVSAFRGRHAVNDFSIGIEVEGTDKDPFEAIQYERLKQILNALTAEYPSIDRENVVGHEHIAPERKWDPGPCFDWKRIGVVKPKA